ncbi:gp97 [Sphingomonas phage PAU]|uniref:gp97 n=1 Tax=Sphingomonas phage PAU TaxID=1150991 RepID=UPI0002573254|nr:gp97 [Sphingomonas phage PAU]AFF28095.1 gp97 [Sphingomonas phage PAU]
MATSGSFTGNKDDSSPDITAVMLNGFTGLMNTLKKNHETVNNISETSEAILSEISRGNKNQNLEAKILINAVAKSYDLVKKETNPILNNIVEAIKNISLNDGTVVTNKDGIQIVKWDEKQFQAFLLNKDDLQQDASKQINSIESLFKTVIGGLSELKEQSKGFSIRNMFSSIFEPSFVKQAKDFTKAYKVVINGISASLITLDKDSKKIERAGNILTSTIEKINSAISDNPNAPAYFKKLAGGIALLGLSLTAFALVSPAVLVAVGALTLLKGVTFVMTRTTAKDMLKISAAIALFGLAIWGLSEIVTLESTLKTATAIILLGLAIKGFTMAIGTGLGRNGLRTLLLTTVSVAALGLALQTYNDVEWESMLKAAGALTVLTGAMYLISKVPSASVGSLALLAGAAAIGAIGLALQLMPKNTDIYLPVGLFIAGFGTTLALAGTVAPFIAAGAAAMLVGGAALLVMGGALAVINAVNYDKAKIDSFTDSLVYLINSIGDPMLIAKAVSASLSSVPMLAVTSMSMVMALELAAIGALGYNNDNVAQFGVGVTLLANVLGNPVLIAKALGATVSSAALLATTSMSLVMALELAAIGALTFNQDNIAVFGEGMKMLSKTYIDLATSIGIIGAAKLTGGVLLATEMALATPPIAFALMSVSIMSRLISNESIDRFDYGLNKLIKVFVDNAPAVLKNRELPKAVRMIRDMSDSTVGISRGISEFVKIADKPDLINTAVTGVGDFVDRMITILSDKGQLLASLPKDAMRILGLGNLMKDIADGMVSMGKLEYYETKLVDGQIVKVGQAKKFTAADFQEVGKSIDLFISAVSEPLAKIGDQGGLFSSNKTKKGIQALSDIGNVFNPIIGIVQAFKLGEKQITNDDAIEITQVLNTIIFGISSTFTKLEQDGTLEYFNTESVMMKGLSDVFKSLGGLKGDELNKVTKEINTVFDRIADDKPFNKLITNLGKIRKEATMIKNEVNKFDLTKLTMFNQMTKNLMDASKTGELHQLVNAIRMLVDEIREVRATPPPQPQPQLPQSIVTNNQQVNEVVSKVTGAKVQEKSKVEVLEEQLTQALELIKTELKNLNRKVQNPMPVQVIKEI